MSWAPLRIRRNTKMWLQRLRGCDPKAVSCNNDLGGGFGSRFETRFCGEAVEISKLFGGPGYGHMVAEDDFTRLLSQSHRRPMHNFEAGPITDGWPVVWAEPHRSLPIVMARFGPPEGTLRSQKR